MNEHIRNYCKSFIESNTSPQFAVFIKGSWGCGKTFFIKKLIDGLKEETRNRVIYLSLFSVGSSDEIDYKLFEAVHPVLSSKLPKYAKMVMRAIIKNRIPGASMFKDLIEDNDSQEKLKDDCLADNRIIIVDDFERSLMKPCDILGYFSALISETNNRVLFVGNEDELSKSKSFRNEKEKTIGAEFSIQADFDDALSDFFNDIPFADNEKKIIYDSIKGIVKTVGCENLRIVREALYNLDLLLDCLPDDCLLVEKCIVDSFFILFIQKNLGQISVDDINDCLHAYYTKKLSYKDYIMAKQKNKDKYWDFPFPHEEQMFFSDDTWKKVVFNGFFERDVLTAEFSAVKDARIRQKERNLYRLFDWVFMDSSEFRRIVEETQKEFDDGKYNHPGEIIHYYSLMTSFIKLGLVPTKKDALRDQVLRIVDQHVAPFDKGSWERMISSGFYGNYGFGNLDNDDMQQMLGIIKVNCTKALEDKAKITLLSCINHLPDEFDEFCKLIRNESSFEFEYLPLLSFIDIPSFYEKIKSLKSERINTLLYSFETRYDRGKTINTQYYAADYENLKSALGLVERDLSVVDKLYNPRAVLLMNAKNRLEKMLELVG